MSPHTSVNTVKYYRLTLSNGILCTILYVSTKRANVREITFQGTPIRLVVKYSLYRTIYTIYNLDNVFIYVAGPSGRAV
jgi:hypothetical protein